MDKRSWIRTVLLILALINQVLSTLGYEPLPLVEGDVEAILTMALTAVVSLIAWWKNNYISVKGLDQKELLKRGGLYKP